MGKAAKPRRKKTAMAEEATMPPKKAAKSRRNPAPAMPDAATKAKQAENRAKASKAKAEKAKAERAKAAKEKVKLPKLKPAKWKEDLRILNPLPVPKKLADAPVPADLKPPKRVRRAESRHLAPLDPGRGEPVPTVLDRLWATVEERRISGNTETSHSARLLARGTAKVAQKLGEEAVEAVIEAMTGNRHALIGESADLLYHLIIVWVDAGIRPEEIWAELVRREGLSGIAEKASRQKLSPAGVMKAGETTKLP
jgi:phosphoribosyl-ATP pyrophosphohydrolase